MLKIRGLRSFGRARPATGSASQEKTSRRGELTPAPALTEEIRSVLQVRRWVPQEAPFRGFDSPPGKF